MFLYITDTNFQYTAYLIYRNSCSLKLRLGPAVGSALYTYGVFTWPFVSTGVCGVLLGLCLIHCTPNVDKTKLNEVEENSYSIEQNISLTGKDILKVRKSYS